MIINQKIGNLRSFDLNDRVIEWIPLEWYETGKRILHKKTSNHKEIVLRFLKENPQWSQDDVVFADKDSVIAINIEPCEVICVQPVTMLEMASLCYEIGNKHLPLFYDENTLMVPYEEPMFRLLKLTGYEPVKDKKQLLQALKTTVLPHSHERSGSLLNRILQLSNTGS